VLLLHGLDDDTVPASCSEEARDRWVAHNGCGAESDDRTVLGGRCSDATGCPEGGQVSLCRFDGMDQGWAGGAAQAQRFLEYADASELIWEFFRAHAW
jgi:poly(3-hydroxybutyrate) depolymerase